MIDALPMNTPLLLRSLLMLLLLLGLAPARADVPAVGERGVAEWLQRMHDASRRRAYIGTLVV